MLCSVGGVLQSCIGRRGVTCISVSAVGSETGKLPRTAGGSLAEEPKCRP